MSGQSGSNTPGRDEQMLAVGQQCSHPSCLLIDFLPLKCQHCTQPYCSEHFMPLAHSCEKFDETKYNRVAPSCPLCNVPVAIPPGEDPNIRMERHFAEDCSVTTGKSAKTKSTPTCDHTKCNKVLFAPIKCDKCARRFCPAHRFPNTHACPSLAAPAAAPRNAAASRANPAAMAALRRVFASGSGKGSSAAASRNVRPPAQPKASASKPAPASSSAKTAAASVPNPFSKTDRSLMPATATPDNNTIVSDNSPPADNDATNDPPQSCASESKQPVSTYSSLKPPPLFASA